MLTQKDIKWLSIATIGAAEFSTCGKRQYMAIVVDTHGHVLSTGYNGGPAGFDHCSDGGCPRFQQGSAPGSNYDNCIAIHAEQNALLHSDYSSRRDGGTLYVNGPPCFTCSKLIANSGLKRLVHTSDPTYADFGRCLRLLGDAGVEVLPVDEVTL